jgi:hypothetical protein
VLEINRIAVECNLNSSNATSVPERSGTATSERNKSICEGC